MPQPPVTVSKSGPGFAQVLKDIRRLQKCDVLVGIPAEKTQRKRQAINNASLLFIHTKGSEVMNIPPRPVLEPSIIENRGIITPHLGQAATLLLNARPVDAERELKLAGITAANGAKRYFLEGKLAPNKPATIARKRRKAKLGEGEEYVDTPLIDTGQMRRAITSVVRYGY